MDGYVDLMISATCTSCLLEAGENTPTMTIFCIPEDKGFKSMFLSCLESTEELEVRIG